MILWCAVACAGSAWGADPALVGVVGAERATIVRGPERWVVTVGGRAVEVDAPVTDADRALLRALVTSLLTDLSLVPTVPVPPPVAVADPLSERLLAALPAARAPSRAEPIPPAPDAPLVPPPPLGEGRGGGGDPGRRSSETAVPPRPDPLPPRGRGGILGGDPAGEDAVAPPIALPLEALAPEPPVAVLAAAPAVAPVDVAPVVLPDLDPPARAPAAPWRVWLAGVYAVRAAVVARPGVGIGVERGGDRGLALAIGVVPARPADFAPETTLAELELVVSGWANAGPVRLAAGPGLAGRRFVQRGDLASQHVVPQLHAAVGLPVAVGPLRVEPAVGAALDLAATLVGHDDVRQTMMPLALRGELRIGARTDRREPEAGSPTSGREPTMGR